MIRKTRLGWLAAFAMLFVMSGVLTSGLRPANSAPKFFPAGSNIQQFLEWQETSYFTTGVWGLDASVLYGCDGQLNSGKKTDACGICGGDGSSCAGCDHVPNSGKVDDRCGVCGGDGSTCPPPSPSTSSSSSSSSSSTTTGSRATTASSTSTSSTTSQNDLTSSSTTAAAASLTSSTASTASTTQNALTSSSSTSASTASTASTTSTASSSTTSDPVTSSSSSSSTIQTTTISGTTSQPQITTVSSTTAASTTGSNRVSTATQSVASSLSTLATQASTATNTVGRTTSPSITSSSSTTSTGTPLITIGTPTSTTDRASTASSTGRDSTTIASSTSTTGSSSSSTTGSNCVYDVCGVCNGDGSSCKGCDGVPNSKKVVDKCGLCGGDDKTCTGCDGVINSGVKVDVCGVCGGDNTCVPTAPTGSNLETVNVIWGILGIDRTHVDVNDPFDEYLGDPIYDSSFDPTTTAAQQYLLNAAFQIVNSSLPVHQKDGEVFGVVAGRSFLTDFLPFLRNRGKPYPLPQSDFMREIAYFLTNYGDYVSDIGVRYDPDTKVGTIKWIRMQFRMNIYANVPSFTAIDTYDAWEQTVDNLNQNAPNEMNKAMQTANIWQRVITEVLAVRNIVIGLIISSTVAVIGTLLFTMNALLTVCVTITLLGNIVCSLAFFKFMGWTLGAVEAISITMLVGLSVDYSLHLADSFGHSKAKAREGRTREALTDMGASVLGGALTTIAAAFVLLFCTIQIFAKFGLIIVVNTFFSILLSLCFFCPLLMTIGPNQNQCDFGQFLGPLWRRITKNFLPLCKCCLPDALGRYIPVSSSTSTSTSLSTNGGLLDDQMSDDDDNEEEIQNDNDAILIR